MPAIQAACSKFSKANAQYNPKLSIVICGKRHHTRFYPTDERNADNNGNPKPGTVVDQGVTAVYNFDFFLQGTNYHLFLLLYPSNEVLPLILYTAHGSLQGTARPTHYYVVHDEIGFKADELQTLTNAVSYMFSRATKAVSLVSPAYFGRLFFMVPLSAMTHRILQLISHVREDDATFTNCCKGSLGSTPMLLTLMSKFSAKPPNYGKQGSIGYSRTPCSIFKNFFFPFC